MSMQLYCKKIESTTLAYSVYGTGNISLVIEMGLGAVIGEWNALAKRISEKHTVLLYERAGYGSSSESTLERTPQNIASELYQLLSEFPCEEKLILLAHSQGGLYAQCFARMYPHMVKKLVLLDPLSARDNYFRTALSKREFRKSGVDKSSGLKLNLCLARLHMGGIIKSMMSSAPPFYYYEGFEPEERDYILSALTMPKMYRTALEEYKLAHDDTYVSELQEKKELEGIAIVLITHSSEISEKEIMEFGNATKEEAEKIEKIWQQLMLEYLGYAKDFRYIRAGNSSHYIHLTDMELVTSVL